ncbi:SusC/RagA family TonB-linked outer membrane protein [Draconibacterium sp. IB214405]|uniref:SusC/RagA family TonB-linked outer membrane protein n=1 Tax=Draconibacterium sp. IB214405 TaxID=3097352 RepID=UPI002A121770|nr:SusC/RagA family TonB-linked outer membrane protein [Draconibacterium sp. IB214405]MDX8339398.1 SusC/RagA family TonB-linked outer membrane protein [Draconibacterium sp. IB214405]
MRLTIILLFGIIFAANASDSYAQAKRMNVELKNSTITAAFDYIEHNSEFIFLYKDEDVRSSDLVNISLENADIETILGELLLGSDLTYNIYDRQVIIRKTDGAVLDGVQDQKNITGVVTDEQGLPLPGVTVIVEGTTIGTITTPDGSFTLTIPDDAQQLHFSFVGMKTQIIPIEGKTSFMVTLETDAIGLEEIVTIGYGVTKRKNFTGSVTTVNMDNSPVMNKATTDAFSLLDGITTGINFTKSGEAGSETELLVRGQKSINDENDPDGFNSSAPLLVVDGIIFSGNMNDIDPSTVENIQVLKDATSLAAYGSKAANGVIMITRKKGIKGKPRISVNTSLGISNPNYTPDMRGAQGYIELMDARTASTTWMSALEQANIDANTPTKYYDMITRTGVQQNYSVNVSGGGEAMDYFIGSSYLDNKNFIVGDQYKRATFTARINTKINDYLSVSASFDQAFNNNDGIAPNYGAAVTLSPWTEPTLPDGRIRLYVDGREETTQHPLWDTKVGRDDEDRRNSTIIGGTVDFKIPGIQGLSYKLTGSYTTNTRLQREFQYETNFVNLALGEAGYTPEAQAAYLDRANGSIEEDKTTSWVIDNILSYTNQFDDHFISATAVYTRDSRRMDSFGMTGTDFTGIGNTNLGFYGLSNAVTQEIQEIGYELHTDVGYLARASYSFKDTYHLNASFRRDGSSVFGSDKKWGNFPAVGAAWTVSNEAFLSSSSFIDNLKLKASWGKNGNQTLRPYGTLSTMNVGRGGGIGYWFDDQILWGQSLATLGNTELAWETTTSFNIGTEIDMYNRIHLEIDGYKSSTTDQIFSRTIPVMGAGITSQMATMGKVDNWGIEAVLNTTNIESGDFRWTSGLTFTLNRNKLVELYGGDEEDDINAGLFIGESLNAIYGYEWIGIVQEDDTEYLAANGGEPGDAMYANIDGSEDGAIGVTDRKILGFGGENFRLSLSNTLTYKNFQLYALFNGIFSGGDYGYQENNLAYMSSDGFQYHNMLNHPWWTPENPSETYPRVNFTDARYTALQKYTFVRLQELNLSYTFDRDLLKKIYFSSLKVFVSGSNLFFIAPDWEYSDPEIRRFNAAQLPRTFTLGINFTL